MPPKKKEEEIDISTLPECISSKAIILCKGKVQRSNKILNKIYTDYHSFITKISRQEVLDHAKQKNIYLDPATLNDKQKKDAKFMESICTELTPQVFAKATKSLIDHLSVKIRLQLKAQNEKKEQERTKPVLEKKMDQLFVFPTDFCHSQQQYEALANGNQGIKYILVINPTVSWANAPQIPEEQAQLEQGQQQDEQIKELKQLRLKEQLSQADIDHDNSIQQNIQQIKAYRSKSSLDSSFRDCIIDTVDCEIDPYGEQKSIDEAVKSFISKLSKLYVEYADFLEWRKDKSKAAIVSGEENLNKQEESSQKNITKPSKNKVEAITPIEILTNFIDSLYSSSSQKQQDEDDIQSLINGFDFNKAIENKNSPQQIPSRRDKRTQFYSENQPISQSEQQKRLEQQVQANLKYPGLHRHMMPDMPLKSTPLRKLQRSHYAQYLNENLPYQEFERRLSLLKFEQIMKEVDEDRKYSFRDRVYQEHHDEKSLTRELYRALALYQDAHFITRYSEEEDKLYLALMYKNNQRRVHNKLWESEWKVLPNYESWLKYFKENQHNLSTQAFYDIDYEKIGHITDQVRAFSIPDGGVMISKKSTIANSTNQFLYAIKNHHLFGLSGNIFYSENQNTKINHFSVAQNQFQTQILIGQNCTIRLLPKTGDIIVKTSQQPRRMYTPDGYTVIYADETEKEYKILHPTGGVSEPNCYINERGLGVKNGIIHNVPTLLRRTQNKGQEILKRDDNTVIIRDHEKKWIKFYQGTEYLIKDNQILIEKKGLPFVKCANGTIQLEINDLVIQGVQNENGDFTFEITFLDGNKLSINGSQVQVRQLLSDTPYIANVSTGQFRIQFANEKLQISSKNVIYTKNGVKFNPIQNEQNYNQSESLPQDNVEPKLFIISPDNTGVEYLSQKQLEYYFALKSDPKNNVISVIPKGTHTENVHVISKVIEPSQINQKRINLNLNIDLDIFKSEKYFKERSLVQRFAVRSLIKHKNLLPEDQQAILEIKDKKQQWLKKARKEQNEFGHKPKGDPSIEHVNKDKQITIDFRKKDLPKVSFEQLRQQAVSDWKSKQKEQMTLVARQEEQEKIRNRLNKKKKSFVESYLPLVINPKEQTEEQENFSQSEFYTHYFETNQGRKALSQMPEWIFRPKTAKVKRQLDPQIVTEMNKTMNQTKKQQQQEQNEQHERYDTVDVNLKPIRQIYIKPSVFTQREIDEERDAFEQEKKAYFYHEKKRKDFNLYGDERKQKVEVKSMLRTQPMSEINQKYLITEAPLDKRIKISSMKNKLTSHASTLVEMRKQGPHQTLLKTLDKRNDYNTLLEKRTMMVHADLNDKLQRDILITPVEAQFGYLKQGRSYEIKITVKNEDILAQRLVVKKARNINVKVMLNEMGPIALGMSRRVIVQIQALPMFMGRFTDEFEIVSKHEIYKIPVTAHILSEAQFEKEGHKLPSNVKEIEEVLMRKTTGLPPIN